MKNKEKQQQHMKNKEKHKKALKFVLLVSASVLALESVEEFLSILLFCSTISLAKA